MNRWRWGAAAIALLLFGLPLASLAAEVLGRPAAWRVWLDGPRLAGLALRTVQLVALTLALALPPGLLGATLFYRSDLPFRRPLRTLTLLTLFVPLPVLASAWQAALGTGGWLPLGGWRTLAPGDPDFSPTGIAWKPWSQGLGAAAWVHAAAVIPWVVWLAGQGLSWVERELEEDALTAAGPLRVFRSVTLPRARAALAAAALWVAVQAATEITVTDMMQVRTFAEEVYAQFVAPEPDPSGRTGRIAPTRAIVVCLPQVLLTMGLLAFAGWRCESRLPPLVMSPDPRVLFRLGHWRWPCLAAVGLVVAVLVGIPLGSLLWKAGLAGTPPAWSANALGRQLRWATHTHTRLIADSLAWSAVAGGVAAGLALVACWLANESRSTRLALLVVVAGLWALPGPVLGIGLKEAINRLMDVEDAVCRPAGVVGFRPLRLLLYDGPSSLPVLWAEVLRFFPMAVAVVWPTVRLLPSDLRDAARVDGATPGQELRYVVWPTAVGVVGRATLAVTALALGELSAGKLVETPGGQTFAHEVFNQMHYGVTGSLAGLCLVQLALTTLPGLLLLGASPWGEPLNSKS